MLLRARHIPGFSCVFLTIKLQKSHQPSQESRAILHIANFQLPLAVLLALLLLLHGGETTMSCSSDNTVCESKIQQFRPKF
jgi:hypothetical protein